MKLSEITFIQWMGAVLVVNGAVLGYSNEVADLFGPVWQKHIFSVMTIGSAIVGGFITIFGGIGTQARNVVAAGGQVNVSPLAATALTTLAQDVGEPAIKSTGTIVKVMIAAFALSAFLAGGSAHAQGLRKPAVTGNLPADIRTDLGITSPGAAPALTGNVEKDVQALWKKIASVTKADLTYAMAKAKAANTNASGIRLQCLQAISDANDQANGVGLTNPDGTPMVRPDPALVTVIEDTAELVDILSPQGKLFTSCAGAAQMFKTNTLAVINSIVTGAAGIAMLPAGL